MQTSNSSITNSITNSVSSATAHNRLRDALRREKVLPPAIVESVIGALEYLGRKNVDTNSNTVTKNMHSNTTNNSNTTDINNATQNRAVSCHAKFLRQLTQLKRVLRLMIWEDFSHLDSDKDGRISGDEYRQLQDVEYMRLGGDSGEMELNATDSDGSGKFNGGASGAIESGTTVFQIFEAILAQL
jgi:hypothetical protein